jgi:hypothetical protein
MADIQDSFSNLFASLWAFREECQWLLAILEVNFVGCGPEPGKHQGFHYPCIKDVTIIGLMPSLNSELPLDEPLPRGFDAHAPGTRVMGLRHIWLILEELISGENSLTCGLS